jgi:hypothetical protein
VWSVEIDLAAGDGETRFDPLDDPVDNIAVSAAGYLAEHLTGHSARLVRSDFRYIRQVLVRLPETERSAVHAEGFRLAETILKGEARCGAEDRERAADAEVRQLHRGMHRRR